MRRKNINKTARVTGTLLGLSAIAVVLVAGVAWLAAAKVDDLSLARERELVSHSIQAVIAALPREQSSVTIWDDAVIETGLDNHQWMSENFGSWLHDYFGMNRSYILAPDGKLRFSMHDGNNSLPPLYSEDESMVASITAKLRDKLVLAARDGTHLPDLAHVEVGVVQGRPAAVSARPILPSSSRVALQREKLSISVVVKFLDGNIANQIQEHVHLEDISFRVSEETERGAGVSVTSGTGQTLGYFSWKPLDPGMTMLKNMAPAALVGLLIAGGVAVILSFSLIRASQRLMMSKEELLRHRDELEETVKLRTCELEVKTCELDRLLAQEREVNAMQRQLVAMTSHEFRTPLAIIDGAAQRLIRAQSNNSAELVESKAIQIRGAVKRMVDLMESILAAAKFQAGALEFKPVPCNLKDLLIRCCESYSQTVETHRLHLELKSLPVDMPLDATLIENVISNLISNAVKYAPDAPDIFVSGSCQNDTVYVSVRDGGPGIDPADVPNRFKPYFRSKSVSGVAGTGIGLTFAMNIVELHGGAISVTSSPTRGSTFTITLPLSAANSQAAKEAA